MTQPTPVKMTLGGLLGPRQSSWADADQDEDDEHVPQAREQLDAAPAPTPATQHQQDNRAPPAMHDSRRDDRPAERRNDSRQDNRRDERDNRQGGGYGGERRPYNDRDDRDRRGGERREYRDDRDRRDDRRQGGGFQRRDERDDRERRPAAGGYERRERDARPPRREAPIPANGPWKAYVGNLVYDLPQERIKAFLEHDGNIKVAQVIVPKRYDDKPVTHVFVEFDSRESLENALKLNNLDLDGRAVHINVAEPHQGESGGSRGGFGERRERERERERAPESSSASSAAPPTERKKLQLAPRSVDATAAASSTSAAPSSKPNPFGEAKPVNVNDKVDAPKSKRDTAATAAKPAEKTDDSKRSGDAASHPVAASSSTASSRPGVVRGGASRPVGTRGADAKQVKAQVPPSKKPAAAPAGPSNVFSALAGDDEEADEE